MRTMKKVIALSLVLAMALSMMATAAFKDQEAINEDLTGDISLMVALNVFSEQGTGAGYFEPNRELTREEVAKLIYVLKNKGNDNGATSWTGMNIFKDIESGRWSEGYINYAASVGMMAGTGEGYFNPTAKMSAVEVAKLLLVLNGYKADVQGYLGTNWDINIIRDAEAAGIFANYDLPVRGSVTREWVARLMNNGINTTKVKYEDGQAMEMYNQQNVPVTFAKQDLGLVETTGILMATANAKIVDSGSAANGGKANCVVKTAEGNKPFKYDAPLSLLGHKVTVLSKGDLDTDVKVYGVTTHKDNVVKTTTVDAVKYDKDKFETGFVVYANYEKTSSSAQTLFAGNNDGRTVTLVDYDNNGKYDAAFVNRVTYDVVKYVNPSSKTLTLKNDSLNGVKYEDINFVDSIAKGDVIKITTDLSTGKAVPTVQKLDVVTGALTKIVGEGNNLVATIDGNEYEVSFKNIDVKLDVQKEAKNYFVDGKYIVFADKISEDDDLPTNFAYVVKAAGNVAGTWGPVNKVEILKNDGTREVLEYKTYENNEPNGYLAFNADNMKGKVYEYVIKDGEVYFKDMGGTSGNGYTFDKSESIFTNKTTKYPVNDDTVFFVVDTENDKYVVMKSSEIKGDINADTKANFVTVSTGLPYVYYAVLSGDAMGESSDGIAISANSYSKELDEDGNDIFKLVVTKLDGTEVTLVADNADVFEGKLGKFVKYNVVNGKVTKENLTAGITGFTPAALTHAEGNAVMISDNGNNTATYMTLADDVKIYYVDAYKSDNKDRIIVSEGDGVIESAETAENKFAKSVLYKTKGTSNADKTIITEIIVEIHGQNIPSALYGA